MLNAAGTALLLVLDPSRLGIMAAGVLIGLALGVVPGLGGIVGLALLIPFTYHMDAYSAFALLLGMAATTTVSDLIPAVLFGVPGTVGAAATVLDGYPLAKQGQAARALGAGYMASLGGGVFGALLLAVTIPILRPVILYLGSAELLAFCVFGLAMVAVLSGKAPLRGLTVACIGLMLAAIGSDPQTGTERWTFDSLYLWDHLPLVPVTLGVFAIPELADMAIVRLGILCPEEGGVRLETASQWQGLRDAGRHWWLVLRCSGLGAMLGAVPGIGSAVIDWIAYGHAVSTERNPETFGKGDIRGVIAAESSNNAKEGGHLIPTLAFGVPAGASMALLLSAFMMHGFTPGPDMLTKHLDVTFSIIWTLTIAHVLGTVICLFASKGFAKLALIRVGMLVPAVLAIVYLGAFNGSQSWGDLYSTVIFGLAAWLMKQLGWPRPPLILGFVLGSTFERYLFISTELFGWNFLARPVVLVVLLGAAFVVLRPLLRATLRIARGGGSRAAWRGPRVQARSLFTVAVLLSVVGAIVQSAGWPLQARLVPWTAAFGALLFGAASLLVEVFGTPSAESATTHMDAAPLDVHGAGLAPSTVAFRAVRFFCWLLATLAGMALVGPAARPVRGDAAVCDAGVRRAAGCVTEARGRVEPGAVACV